jgi:hypothetical protein
MMRGRIEGDHWNHTPLKLGQTLRQMPSQRPNLVNCKEEMSGRALLG